MADTPPPQPPYGPQPQPPYGSPPKQQRYAGPAPYQAQPARPAQRSRVGLIVGGIAAVVVVALIVGIGIWASGWVKAATSPPTVITGPASAEVPSFTPRPTPSVSATKRTDAIPIVYAAALGGACKPLSAATDWASVRTLIAAQQACLDVQWSAVFRKAGRSFTPPQVSFVTGDLTTTKCADEGLDPKVYPAHYCNPDAYTIYVFDTVTKAVVADRAFAFTVLAHEYAHHVQYLLGAVTGSSTRDPELTRRIELQAQCVSMHALARTTGLNTSKADLDQVKADWNRDTPHHGSAVARTFWNQRGYAAATIGECDTFSAPASQVT